MKFLKGALCGALATLLAVGILSCGPGLNRGEGATGAVGGETDKKLRALGRLIDKSYIGEVDEDELQSGIYEGYISGLGDPYSEYYDEEATKKLQEVLSGEYEGIGAVMSADQDTGVITIAEVYEDSPAEKAGLLAEDILYKVDGEEVTGRELDDVVADIRGEEGTEVEITVLRGEDAREFTAAVIRGPVETPTVTAKLLEDGIGYLRISEFDSVTYDQFMEELDGLESQGIEGLVIDLRSNPGGNYAIVCDILDEMLPEGLIVYTEDKNGKRDEVRSDGEHQFQMPYTVLVNEYSASASEIFAGAVQDYNAGKIVGMNTYGKGVVQQIYSLKDGTSVKLTVSEYFTPKGRSINGKGIAPDVEAEYVPDEENPDEDSQLDKAVEVLKGEMQDDGID